MGNAHIVKHYILLLMQKQGLNIDTDTHAELDEALAPLDEAEKRLNRLEVFVAHLERETSGNANNS